MEGKKKMKYTKYDDYKRVYIIGKNQTSKRESKAEWKEDIGIPTTEFDIKSIISTIEETGKGTGIIRQPSFVVLHNEKRYIVQFCFYRDYTSSAIIMELDCDNCSLNNLFYCTKRNIRTSIYLITEEDIGTWEKSKKQIAENFKLSSSDRIGISIY